MLLLLAVFLVYGRILGHEFITTWDDDAYLLDNPAIRGVTLHNLQLAFSRFYVGNYAPVQIVSYMLDYTLWGLAPWGFHLVDMLLHAGNASMIYLLIVRLGGSRIPALFGALFFLCHPVQVEAVAWVSQRKTVLSAFFMLASWLFFLAREYNRTGHLFYALSLISFLLSTLTKGITVVFPLILAIHWLLTGERTESLKRWAVRLAPFVVISVAMSLVTLISQSAAQGGGRTPYHGGSLWATLFTMLPVYCKYLRMLLFPYGLSAEYEVPLRLRPDAVFLGAVSLLALAGYGCYRLYRQNRSMFFWVTVFIVGFLPVSQIVPIVTPINDRYFYLPMTGGSGLLASVLQKLLDTRPALRRTIVLAVAVIVIVLGGMSWQRAAVWKNGMTLWEDVVAKAPLNYEAWDSLGSSYIEGDREELALRAYKRALALNPDYGLSLKNLGMLFLKRGETDQALRHFRRLTSLQPRNAEAWEFLGLALKLSGDLKGAEVALLTSLQLEPRRASALVLLARIEVLQGRLTQARDYLVRAKSLDGKSADVESGLSLVEAGMGNEAAALHHLETLLKVGADTAMVLSDPAFARIRQSDSFCTLLQRYGIPESSTTR